MIDSIQSFSHTPSLHNIHRTRASQNSLCHAGLPPTKKGAHRRASERKYPLYIISAASSSSWEVCKGQEQKKCIPDQGCHPTSPQAPPANGHREQTHASVSEAELRLYPAPHTKPNPTCKEWAWVSSRACTAWEACLSDTRTGESLKYHISSIHAQNLSQRKFITQRNTKARREARRCLPQSHTLTSQAAVFSSFFPQPLLAQATREAYVNPLPHYHPQERVLEPRVG